MKLHKPETPLTLTVAAAAADTTVAALCPRLALAALAVVAAAALPLAPPLRAATWSTGDPDTPITSNRTVTVNGSGTETVSTPLTGSNTGVTLTKLGTGTLTLGGTLDGYAGNLVVGNAEGKATPVGGTLVLAGNNTGYTGNVTVGPVSTLSVASDDNFGIGTYTLYGHYVAGNYSTLLLTGANDTVYSKNIALRTSYNIISTANDVTWSGVLSNSDSNVTNGFTKEGEGTLTFDGEKLTGTTTAKDADYTATGALVVTATGGATFDNALDFVSAEIAGAAAFNNTLDAVSGVAVLDGGTLGGSGTITGNVSIADGGTLAPGNSPGALTVNGNVTLESGATTLFEIGGDGDGEYDQLIIRDEAGTLTLGGTLELVSYKNYAGVEGDAFRIFDLVSGASVNGEFTSINDFALGEGLVWDYTALYTEGVVSIMGSAVPEPAAWAVLAGLALLVWAALRRPRPRISPRRV